MGMIENKFHFTQHPANVLTRRKKKYLELRRQAAKKSSNQEEGKYISLGRFQRGQSISLQFN